MTIEKIEKMGGIPVYDVIKQVIGISF